MRLMASAARSTSLPPSIVRAKHSYSCSYSWVPCSGCACCSRSSCDVWPKISKRQRPAYRHAVAHTLQCRAAEACERELRAATFSHKLERHCCASSARCVE